MRHAVLGLLVQRPGNGSELAQRFRHQVGEAWGLDTSHVYKVLVQLESEKLVVVGVGRRGDRRYVVTGGGRREFERWLVGGRVRLQPLREELYLRIVLCPPRHFGGLLEVISLQERATYEALERLSAGRALEDALRPPIAWRRVATQLVFAGQIARFEADLAWLRDTRKTLEWLRGQEVRWSERSVPVGDDEQAAG